MVQINFKVEYVQCVTSRGGYIINVSMKGKFLTIRGGVCECMTYCNNKLSYTIFISVSPTFHRFECVTSVSRVRHFL